jgi:thiol-disulfide isomerase/thioredoxin
MKRISILLLTSILLLSCKKQETINIEYLSKKFNNSTENIDKVQYNGTLKMKLSNGSISENIGFAIIEKEPNDTIFGFSFYGIRTNINRATIYKNGVGFLISTDNNKFKRVDPESSIIGRYGGPIIYKDFFKLENDYENVNVSETEDSFILDYKFEDDIKNNITQKSKKLELDKKNFLPKKVTTSLQPDFGDKQTIVYVFENLKTNENIEKNINEYVKDLNKFVLIKEEKSKPNPLLKKSLPEISLKNLFNENETIEIKTDKVTLIDFWEVWCGWCIKSFPEVEKIKNKYENDLTVIGIVSQDKENAVKLVKKKGATFLNLIGNKELKKVFSVNSLPRYFLIDKNGIIQKEYHGFSNEIEKDIQELIRK